MTSQLARPPGLSGSECADAFGANPDGSTASQARGRSRGANAQDGCVDRARNGPKKRKCLILWRARQESNLYQELRKLSFYPLNYGRKEATLYPYFAPLRRRSGQTS